MMDEMRMTLAAGLPELGLELSEQTQKTLCDFGCAVVRQNEVMNLTAITAPDQVAAIQQAHETAQGIEPPTDGSAWSPDTTYRRGARVTEDGIGYTSLVPYNRAWRPSQTTGHAWVRDTPEPEEPGGVAPWASGVAYQPGDQVTHDGQTWEAKIAHTSHDGWKPSAHTHAVWTRTT